MDNITNKMDFQDYKKLTMEEREYFLFDTLCRIDDRTCHLDEKYAGKWVEHILRWSGATFITALLGALGTWIVTHR